MEIKVSQKRNEIQTEIASLKYDVYRLESDLMPNSTTKDQRKCREDHRDRLKNQIKRLNTYFNRFKNYQENDVVITCDEYGAIIVLSEGFEVEFNLSVMNEIEGY